MNGYSEGYAVVGVRVAPGEAGLRYGFIDKSGQEAIPVQYGGAGQFSEGLAAVRAERGLWGYIDKSGKTVVRPSFRSAGMFRSGIARVATVQDLEGYISKDLRWVWRPVDPMQEYLDEVRRLKDAAATRGADQYRGRDAVCDSGMVGTKTCLTR